MRTFLKLTAISIQSHLYYRTSFILNLLSPIVLLAGQYLLWSALYAQQGGAAIGGMERQEMFAYILLAFAVALRLMMIDVFSLLCFFTTGYLGISWTRAAMFDFFSGAMIPVALFPGWLKTAACFTPFPYMLQVPVAALLGQDTLVGLPGVYGVQIVWILVLLALHSLIYGLVRRNLTIAGG